MPTSRTPPRLARAFAAVLIVEVMVFTATTTPGVRDSGFDPLIDGWLQGAAYVITAVVAAIRPITSSVNRRAWTWIAGGLAARAFGFVAFLVYVRTLDSQPIPSVADIGWLAMYPMVLIGLISLAGRRSSGVAATALLDGIVGACAVGAVFFTALYGTLQMYTAPGTPTSVVAINLAYPILDAALVLMLIAVLIGSNYRLTGQLWMLFGAVLGFAIGDSIFLYQAAAGDFRPGSLVSALALGATSLMALAAWFPAKPAVALRAQSLPGLTLSGVFSLACLGVVVYGTRTHVPTGATVFATAGLLIAIGRAATSFRDAKAIAQARHDARTDELTGLPNRRAFHEELERALNGRQAIRPLALLILDLDEFKLVNDTAGHHGGDVVLSLVGPRLRLSLTGGDFLARIGGDEFALLVENRNAASVEEIAQQLRSDLREPFAVGDDEFRLDVTVGIAMFPEDGRDGSDLIARADVAMYDAKNSGAGLGFYHAERHQSTRGRLEGYERVRQAIDGGELVLHYQPQVALDDGAVVAVEALVRWQHPELGLLPPARFLPVVVGGGLMRLLTGAVLERAIAQCSDWWASGHETTVAVNVSVTDLLDPAFPAEVTALLDRFAMHPSSLVLELTEDLPMTKRAKGREAIASLRQHGVIVLIDDYGTGFSSLDYLHDLHGIGGLKLDRKFVTNVDSDARSLAIISSTASLAASLDLDLIIEGVETAAQCDLLRGLGCRYLQGFRFGRPQPAEQVVFGDVDFAVAS